MDQHAFEEFRGAQHRRHSQVWAVALTVSVGGFFLLGVLWTYIAGVAEAVIVPLAAYELIRRWNRRRWLQRFPELREQSFPWIPDRTGRSGGRLQ